MKVIGALLMLIVLVAATVGIGGALTMFWLGFVHEHFGALAPLSFLDSTALFVLTSMLVGFSRGIVSVERG